MPSLQIPFKKGFSFHDTFSKGRLVTSHTDFNLTY